MTAPIRLRDIAADRRLDMLLLAGRQLFERCEHLFCSGDQLPVLVGAMAAHLGNGWVFSNANGGWEYPLFLIAMSVVHAMLGDGAFALSGKRAGHAMTLKTA